MRRHPRRPAARVASAAIGLVLAGAGCAGGSADPVASVPTVAPVPTVEQRTVDAGGTARPYRLYSPPGRRGPLPLVLALHGGGNTAESLVQTTQLDAKAADHGFLVAYPDAAGVWNAGFCCTGGRGDPSADVAFLDRVITDVAAARRVDAARVFAVGVSAGGVMAYRLACDLAPRLAGIGSVAGTMLLDDCHPAQPVSVVAIHGTGDGIVPFHGGPVISPRVATQPSPPAPAVAERWATLNGCRGPATSTGDSPVSVTGWADCEGGRIVRLIRIEGGGHTWFATEFGLPDGAVDATDTFLEAFGLVG